ncbi:hypothetical protein [Catalinimonas alkaloidigena]|uniref:hypothetical protein n=1 Tax=Catalinimonas alkaloidigena TaxID=1075417 RepID=UPI002404F2A6|nr:hypothetical protein [Catalinimonas alkaloidigena]
MIAKTRYRFDITDYVTEKLLNDAISEDFLLLTVPSYNKSVSRLYLGSSQHEEYITRLEISYTQLNSTNY